jgi:hypothetical protein
MNLVRFVITWEALEHEGPGIYDEEYLAYLRKVLIIAEKKGISVFMDPHQAVWSRMTGGDGAPAWTLEKLGIDLEKLEVTGATLNTARYLEQNKQRPLGTMIWPSNYNRYAAATMFTLFFGGNTYAPETKIEGEPAQDWLQEQYLACMRHCYRRLKNCGAVIGWGTMNGPHPGFIGYQNLEGLENYHLTLGPMPSPFQAMAAASGYPVEVPVYRMGILGSRIRGREAYTSGESIFRPGFTCPWKTAGVWSDDGGVPRLLRRDHFARLGDKAASFADDFLKPFMLRFTERMREAKPRALMFIETMPNKSPPAWNEDDPSAVVHVIHRYNGPTLFTKGFRPWLGFNIEKGRPILGRRRVKAYFSRSLEQLVTWTREHMEDMPCLLGEFGFPFDMNRRRAFKTGDHRLYEKVLSIYYDAMDAHLLHGTILSCTVDNTDSWNGEELSTIPKGEAQGMEPYPLATAGTPISLCWDRRRKVFMYCYVPDPDISAPTVLFTPPECFGPSPSISVVTDKGEAAPVRVEYHPEDSRAFLFFSGPSGNFAHFLVRMK